MCRVLAYIGPEIPVESLLLEPENSLINQTLDPELHPLLQLAGWGYGIWSDHLLKPEEPLLYRRPLAAFYDDNANNIIPSLQAHTLLSHVRAAGYDDGTSLADENCHPIAFKETPWIIAQNGALHDWRLLQKELLQHCEGKYIEQMSGSTDTEFLYVLLLSLMKSDDDKDIQSAFEEMLRLIIQAQKKLDLLDLVKLKIALVRPNKIIGVNYGSDKDGQTEIDDDWKALRKEPNKDISRSMLLEPMYLMTGKNFQDHEGTYDVDVCADDDATLAIFSSEPLTDDTEDWLEIEFGQMISLENKDSKIKKKVTQLNV